MMKYIVADRLKLYVFVLYREKLICAVSSASRGGPSKNTWLHGVRVCMVPFEALLSLSRDNICDSCSVTYRISNHMMREDLRVHLGIHEDKQLYSRKNAHLVGLASCGQTSVFTRSLRSTLLPLKASNVLSVA